MATLVSQANVNRLLASALLGFALVACGSEPPPPPPKPTTTIPPPPPDQVNAADWEAMVACEATGNWAANTGNGFHGGLQFNPGTWSSHGGGDFAATADLATAIQQMEVANRILAAQGWSAWPHCSNTAGVAWKLPAPPGTFVPLFAPPKAAP